MKRRMGRSRMSSAELAPLMDLPGVGVSIARDLLDLGVRRPEDLHGRNPQQLYEALCEIRRAKLDRCMLYVFRCAVYAVETPRPHARLLKWWNWKDSGSESSTRGAHRRRVAAVSLRS